MVNSSTEKTTTRISQECHAAQDNTKAAGHTVKGVDCTLTTTSTTNAARSVTAVDILADTTLKSTDRTELLAAAAADAVYSKHFSWFTTGGANTVTHNGTFYYNGSKAWAQTSYAGYQGSYFCFTNFAAGVAISIQQCYEVGTTVERDSYSQWQVTWPWGPPCFGLSYSVSHWGSVYGNGTTS